MYLTLFNLSQTNNKYKSKNYTFCGFYSLITALIICKQNVGLLRKPDLQLPLKSKKWVYEYILCWVYIKHVNLWDLPLNWCTTDLSKLTIPPAFTWSTKRNYTNNNNNYIYSYINQLFVDWVKNAAQHCGDIGIHYWNIFSHVYFSHSHTQTLEKKRNCQSFCLSQAYERTCVSTLKYLKFVELTRLNQIVLLTAKLHMNATRMTSKLNCQYGLAGLTDGSQVWPFRKNAKIGENIGVILYKY